MRLTMADHVRGVAVDGDLVLLDVTEDVYFCLPAGDFVATVAGRTIEAWPDALGESLCDAGMARRADEIAPAINLPPSPRRTARAALDADPRLKGAPIAWRHLHALIRAAGQARQAARRPFVDRLGTRGARPSVLTSALLADIAVYRRLSPWLPVDGPCFFRCQMLRAYLANLGHRVDWSFGVRTWPFHAHCWLQVEDMALDDEAERLAAYRPIMAV